MIFPLLEISASSDPRPLAQVIERLDTYDLAIFISPNAVAFALPVILAHSPWPSRLQPAAVGQGTVKALAAHGLTGCLAPRQRFDSEALLALPELASVAGKRIAIFRGEGGRELLADTLISRGACVDCVACYRRSAPASDGSPLLAAWRRGEIDALTLSSSEGLRHLCALLDDEGWRFLQATPLFVTHARIGENALNAGLNKIILSSPDDGGIVTALLAHTWSLSAKQ